MQAPEEHILERKGQDPLLSSLLDMIPDPFIVISEDGTYLEVIGAAERTLYDEPALLKGQNIYDFMEKEFAQFFMDQVRLVLSNKQLHSFEYQLETNTVQGIPKNGPGGKQWFEARLYPLQEPIQGKRAVIALIINITARKSFQSQLHKLSYQDPLTKVANRRYFFEQLEDRLKKCKNTERHMSVIIMDVDHFKRINDQYGHLAGDHMLKMLAQLATEHFTSDELIARFGGDEFVILLCSALNETVEKAESFRLAVKSQRIKFDNYELTMTVSIGISELTTLDNDGTNIITRADKALYRAKQQGRNRVQWG